MFIYTEDGFKLIIQVNMIAYFFLSTPNANMQFCQYKYTR
ncbi:hypothetical protein SAMN04488511_11552 [Pedobacter suwonensis]|uniref:Uncharacterized protein n=1 Tax=Pedobacter suwonensis TaxID=332999 RepID=A0A1I0TVQ3_9SPHI|nr:hypothetical protein SAMN04488511_11552 [Pedobacter suwonensis]